MRIFELHREIWLPRPRDEVFAFFADAANLQLLTPPWVDFEILSPLPIQIRKGALIDYRIKVHRLPLRWRTEITTWEPPFRFKDVQLRGPYRQWEHEHRFDEVDGGTLMTDHVEYAPIGGWIIQKLFVEKDVEKIFNFRERKMLELFPRSPEEMPAQSSTG